jgi:hypothetical protein
MTHPRIKARYDTDGDINHEVGDMIIYGGNQGRIVAVSDTGMITVKAGDQQQVLDPATVFIWNQRIAYQQLVDGVGIPDSDVYIRKDELLANILTHMARYNQERANGKMADIYSQIYYDILNLLSPKNTNKITPEMKDSF